VDYEIGLSSRSGPGLWWAGTGPSVDRDRDGTGQAGPMAGTGPGTMEGQDTDKGTRRHQEYRARPLEAKDRTQGGTGPGQGQDTGRDRNRNRTRQDKTTGPKSKSHRDNREPKNRERYGGPQGKSGYEHTGQGQGDLPGHIRQGNHRPRGTRAIEPLVRQTGIDQGQQEH